MLKKWQLASIILHGSYFSVFHAACEHAGCFTSDGNLTSANYPDNYDPNPYDSWLITAPEGQTVTIYFVDIALELESSCTQQAGDYLFLYDGSSTSDTILGTLCSRAGSGCLETSSHNLLITFTSDSFVLYAEARGFFARFYLGGQYVNIQCYHDIISD